MAVRTSLLSSPAWAILTAMAVLGGFVVKEQSGILVQVPTSSASKSRTTTTTASASAVRRGGGLPPRDDDEPPHDDDPVIKKLEEQIRVLEVRLERLRRNNDDNTSGFRMDNVTQPGAPSSYHQQPQQLQQQQQSSSYRQQQLPPCDQLMQQPHSPFKDGSFLTSHTTKIRWIPRADGSRQLELQEICILKRYSSMEANQCLTNKHMSMIGDSLTRYQHLSLAHLLEHGHFPPRFARPKSVNDTCRHVDEHGHATCAPMNEPNVCVESDWKGWDNYYGQLCGSTNGGLFGGHMECNSYRIKGSQKLEWNDNMLYVHPASRATLSFSFETGMGAGKEAHLFGFEYSNCTRQGNCRRTDGDTRRIKDRTLRGDYDWNQSFPEAISKAHNGSLLSVLPPVDYAIYNRGIWGLLSEDRAQRILPLMHEWVHHKDGSSGRCFFKSSTAHSKSMRVDQWEHEVRNIRPHALYAGCSFLDYGYLTQGFAALDFDGARRDPSAERHSVFVDPVHYHPWVYEELNQVLLNVLCNDKENESVAAAKLSAELSRK